MDELSVSKLKKELKIVSIIPARGGSKAIPQKNIVDFCGKPLLAWTIEHALNSRFIEKVYVSTDDPKIAEVATNYGAKVIERSKELATDTSPSEEALLHALMYIEEKEGLKPDIVVFLQCTSPLREPEDIDNAIRKFIKEKADSLFSVAKLEDFCVWKKENNTWISVTFDYKNRGMRQDREPYYLENGSIYIFKPEILKKYKNRLGGRITIYEMPYWKSYEIDSWEDLEICEYFMRKKLLSKKQYIPLDKIKLIVYDFDGVMTDNKVIVNQDGKESVVVNRADGLAVGILRKKGIEQVIITTETNPVVIARAQKLKLPVIHSVEDKRKVLEEFCKKNKIALENVVYIGNDINDIEAMRLVGWPVCPADAADEVKKISKVIISRRGGEGVIRELLKILNISEEAE